MTPAHQRPLRILIACERSGIVRDAFRAKGHHAYSCDVEPCEADPEHHIQADAIETAYGQPWDMMIAHPECTYLSSSGIHWYWRRDGREADTEAAVEFARQLWNAPIRKVAMENPIGILSRRLRQPDQILQPFEFGHDASKATCLWLSGPNVRTVDRTNRRPR